MTVRDAVVNRRSIRNYTGKQLSDQQIETLLEAGFYAPTARNMRPLHFIVIREREALEAIAKEQTNAKYVLEAGCGILVCGDRTLDVDGYLVEDGSAAIQNMLLTAYEMGLGALWCGVYPREVRIEHFRKLCRLPEHILPIGLVVAGHTEQAPERPERVDQSRIHFEIWETEK
jgi:nitroreductase